MADRLTPEERLMLQEQLRHEEVCIQEYRSCAGRAVDRTVRSIFNEFAGDEQDHYNTLNRLLGNEGVRRDPGPEVRTGPDYRQSESREWEGTAKRLLFEKEGDSGGKQPPRLDRGSQWGGLLPGDVPDVNHGDLTRGGLDMRGVNLAGVGKPERG